MPVFTNSYSVSSDFVSLDVPGVANPSLLLIEVEDSSIASAILQEINVIGDTLTFCWDTDLSAGDEVTLDAIVAAHTGTFPGGEPGEGPPGENAGSFVILNQGVILDNDPHTRIDFVGSGVAAVDVDGGTTAQVTISGTTASNVGSGADVFKQKTGNDLEFRGINAASSKVSAIVNLDNVDVDVIEANINHDALSNFVLNEHLDWTQDQGATDVHADNVPDGADATAIHDNTAGEINAIAAKGTPVSADVLIIEDSAASFVKKKIGIGDLPFGKVYEFAINPTVNDDAPTYQVGDIWVNTVTDTFFILTDSADGAAVWSEGGANGADEPSYAKLSFVGSTQADLTADVWVKFDLFDNVFDAGGTQAVANSTTDRITVGSTGGGIYLIEFSLCYNVDTSGVVTIAVRKNNVIVAESTIAHEVSNGQTAYSTGAALVQLLDTDYVELWLKSDAENQDPTFEAASFHIARQAGGEIGPQGPAGPAVEVLDEGSTLTTGVSKINFVGAGVTATEPMSNEITVTIPGTGSDITVEDEGTPLTATVTKFNFAGAGVTVTEPAADEVLVTIPGGGSANLDGGEPDTNFGGIPAVDGGTP